MDQKVPPPPPAKKYRPPIKGSYPLSPWKIYHFKILKFFLYLSGRGEIYLKSIKTTLEN